MLVNPAARAGTGGTIATRAAERLRERGIRATVISGGSAAESTELLKQAVRLGTNAVAVAGGDGTVSLAMQVLAHSATPLGIIPAGTGNDIAEMLGIREMRPDEAADAIAQGATREIDLARIRRHGHPDVYFGSVLASGFDSRVNDRANRMRWPRGSSRYTIAILRELVALRSIAYEVELTDAEGAVTPEVGMHRARTVRLSAQGVTAYADDDPIGPLPVEVDVAPRALRVFVS